METYKINKYTHVLKTFESVARIFSVTWQCHGETEKLMSSPLFKNAAILVADKTFGGKREFSVFRDYFILSERYYTHNSKIFYNGDFYPTIIISLLKNRKYIARISNNNAWTLYPHADSGEDYEEGLCSWSILTEDNLLSLTCNSGSSDSRLSVTRLSDGTWEVTLFTPQVAEGEEEYKGNYYQSFMAEVNTDQEDKK